MAKTQSTQAAITALENKQLPAQFERGYTQGGNGYVETGLDVMATKIPQIHALLTVLTGGDWPWNAEIKQCLTDLAYGLSAEIHEAYEEHMHERIEASKH